MIIPVMIMAFFSITDGYCVGLRLVLVWIDIGFVEGCRFLLSFSRVTNPVYHKKGTSCKLALVE